MTKETRALMNSIKDICIAERNKGATQTEIAKTLDKMGFKSVEGKKISNSFVSMVLRNSGMRTYKLRNTSKTKKQSQPKAVTTDAYADMLDVMTSNLSEQTKRRLCKALASDL